MALYLIKRGPRPDYHRAPYHPVIVCRYKAAADWETGCTCKRATVWSHDPKEKWGGWLLHRWQGLVIDYGQGVMHACEPVEGVRGGYYHDPRGEPWTLLNGAVWWDDKKMPDWLKDAGVIYPPDDFTQQVILDFIADERAEQEHRNALRKASPGTVVMSFSASGFGRQVPDFWPNGLTLTEWEMREADRG